jgi:hypothetical protein
MNQAFTKPIADLDGKRVWLHLDRTGALLGWSSSGDGGSHVHHAPDGAKRGSTRDLDEWAGVLAPGMRMAATSVPPPAIPSAPALRGGGAPWAVAAGVVVVSAGYFMVRDMIRSGFFHAPIPAQAASPQAAAVVPAKGAPTVAVDESPVVSRSPDGQFSISLFPEGEGVKRLQISHQGRSVISTKFPGEFAESSWSPSGAYLAINDRNPVRGAHLWIFALESAMILTTPDERNNSAIDRALREAVTTEAGKRWSSYRLQSLDWTALGWKEGDLLELRAEGRVSPVDEGGGEQVIRAEGVLRVEGNRVSVQSVVVPYSAAVAKTARQATAAPPAAPGPKMLSTSPPPPAPVQQREAPETAGRVAPASQAEQIKPRKPPAMPAGQPMPGEQFFETRSRQLGAADLAAYDGDKVRYAINEMFARRGGTFADKDLQIVFSTKSWYWPRPELTFDQIEKEFSPTETANFHALVRRRTELADKRDNPKEARTPDNNPAGKRRPTPPPARRDGLEDLDRY